jgi:multiple sugar transport system substrate-binding protein
MKKNLLGIVVVMIILNLCLSSVVFAAEKIEMKVWMGSWWEGSAPLIVEEFEKAYPQYDLKIDALPLSGYFDSATAAILAGAPPDILALDITVLSTFAAKGLLTDLTADVGEKLNAADFLPACWNTSHYEGKMYGMPYRSCGNVMYYNKKMFDDAGVEYPKKGWTFDDLLDKAQKITVPGEKYGFFLSADMSDMGSLMNYFCAPIWGFGGDILNEDYTKCTMDQPNAIKGLTWLTETYTKYKVVPEGTIGMTGPKDGIPLFSLNKVAVYTHSDSAIRLFNEYPDLEWDVSEWPNGGLSRSGGWSFTVPVTAKYKKEAIDFLLWFAKPEVQAKVCFTAPSNIHAWELAEPWNTALYQNFLEASKNGKTMPTIGNWGEIQDILAKEWQKALLGQKTPEQAAKDMCLQIDPLLK